MSVWTDELRVVVERARAKAAAAGELSPKPGPTHWDLPQSIRDAMWEDMDSGAYEEAARAATAGDPEMTQL